MNRIDAFQTIVELKSDLSFKLKLKFSYFHKNKSIVY